MIPVPIIAKNGNARNEELCPPPQVFPCIFCEYKPAPRRGSICAAGGWFCYFKSGLYFKYLSTRAAKIEKRHGAGAGMAADDRADGMDADILRAEFFPAPGPATYSASPRQSPWLMNTVWEAGSTASFSICATSASRLALRPRTFPWGSDDPRHPRAAPAMLSIVPKKRRRTGHTPAALEMIQVVHREPVGQMQLVFLQPPGRFFNAAARLLLRAAW